MYNTKLRHIHTLYPIPMHVHICVCTGTTQAHMHIHTPHHHGYTNIHAYALAYKCACTTNYSSAHVHTHACVHIAHTWRHSHTPSSYPFLLVFPLHVSVCSCFLASSLLVNIPNIETIMISFRTVTNMITLATRPGFIYLSTWWMSRPVHTVWGFHNLPEQREHQIIEA